MKGTLIPPSLLWFLKSRFGAVLACAHRPISYSRADKPAYSPWTIPDKRVVIAEVFITAHQPSLTEYTNLLS